MVLCDLRLSQVGHSYVPEVNIPAAPQGTVIWVGHHFLQGQPRAVQQRCCGFASLHFVRIANVLAEVSAWALNLKNYFLKA